MCDLPDDRQYVSDGSEVVVVSTFDGGVVVRDIIECEDGPEQLGRHRIVDRVFASPPTHKVSAEVERLNTLRMKLANECHGLKDELKALEKEKASFLASHRHVTQVQRLVDFLEGRITHFAQRDYHRVSIFGWDGFKCEDDPRKLKLVTLLGDVGGDLCWNLNRYSDGSGRSDSTIVPCTSYADAVIEAQNFANGIVATHRKNQNAYLSSEFFVSAAKYGLVIPQDIIDERKAAEKAATIKAIETKKAELAKLEAELCVEKP